MNFEPLEIKMAIRTPVITPLRRQPHPLHLDALLISIMTARVKHVFPNLTADVAYDDPYSPENGHKQGVPFAVCGNKRPIYQSSVAFLAGDSVITEYNWIKKTIEPEVLKVFTKNKKGATFKPSGDPSGPRRPWMETTPGILPAQIKFECVGDRETIIDLLADVRGLGVMRRIGLGEIIAYSVIPTSEDSNICGLIYNGQPARELPIIDWPDGDKKGWNAVSVTSRPPYWNPRNKDICWCPPLEITVPGLAQASRVAKNSVSNEE